MLGLRKNPYRPLEKQLGYAFRKRALLETALTHPSCRAARPGVQADNQRLEFLGDAALGLAAAAHCYRQFDSHDEGTLTSVRSTLTCGATLARVARAIGLGAFLRLGRGEEQSHGRERASILTDAMEAVIGAAYLDGGMRAVGRVFERLFVPRIIEGMAAPWRDNPKGELQDLAQRLWQVAPRYTVVAEHGPMHSRRYTIEVKCGSNLTGRGSGSNKQEAEKNAASDALSHSGSQVVP